MNGGTKPMYLGRRFRQNGNNERIFNSGGAAYVLNQAAVEVLADHLDDEACEAHRKCFWEDVQVGECAAWHGARGCRPGWMRISWNVIRPQPVKQREAVVRTYESFVVLRHDKALNELACSRLVQDSDPRMHNKVAANSFTLVLQLFIFLWIEWSSMYIVAFL